MVTQRFPSQVTRGPYTAILRKARRHHRDCLTQDYIYPDEQYYQITVANSGLRGSKIYPDRVRPENLGLYFIRRGV